ncbi:hypothetical protein C4552_02070 [Candidatus Parcubacteria bacterium]|nr:MAG: hypothetical protein C4552_02070 [Candidatus Parcubacteria bacterium]
MAHPRIENPTRESSVAALATYVLALPRPIERVDALVALLGEGEAERLTYPISWWERVDRDGNRAVRARYLLVAPHNRRERTSERLDIARLRQPPYNLTRTDGVIWDDHAEHTAEQAQWFARMARAYGIKSAALFAPPYHIVRAYLTFVLRLQLTWTQVQLIPAPIPVPPMRISPESSATGWALIPGETKRIIQYQHKGDVATLAKLTEYLGWLWAQPLMRDEDALLGVSPRFR